MAKGFTGWSSPDNSPHDNQRNLLPAPRHALEGRPKWVTIAATPFLLGAFFQAPAGMVTALVGFGLVASGMWLTREGLRAEASYRARRSARRPAVPRKMIGGLLAGLGFGIGAFEPGAAVGAGLIGMVGMALHWLAFGADPLRDKGMEGGDRFQQERAARMIEEGQAHLGQMKAAIRRSGDQRLEAKVAMFDAAVQELFEQIRLDPGDLGAVRRYMGVYLMGARDATVKFVDLYSRTQDNRARAAYEELLTDLEKDFSARSRQLLEGDRDDLSIEISVLRDRLSREGVRPDMQTEHPAPKSQAAQTLDDLLAEAGERQKAD